jgi:hypothetical protein
MDGLESQEEDALRCILFFKPMSWLGQIRGAQIPVITENPLADCGCRKFHLDTMPDHLCTCTTHSDAKKAHDWVVE